MRTFVKKYFLLVALLFCCTHSLATPPGKIAPDGRRIPELALMEFECKPFGKGEGKVPARVEDCQAEVLAFRSIQCRADWFTHPATEEMNVCFKKKGVADISEW